MGTRAEGWFEPLVKENRDRPTPVIGDSEAWFLHPASRDTKRGKSKRAGLRAVVSGRIVKGAISLPEQDGEIT